MAIDREGFEAPIITRNGIQYAYAGLHVFYEACGCSRAGIPTKRHGQHVRCGHRHKTMNAAQKCADRMQTFKPGNCQMYRAIETHKVSYRAIRP